MKAVLCTIGLSFMLCGCWPTKERYEFELSLESCYAMKNDHSHPYWKQPIAVQGCDMLISEFEMEKLKASRVD